MALINLDKHQKEHALLNLLQPEQTGANLAAELAALEGGAPVGRAGTWSNQLLQVEPTLRCATFDAAGVAQYTSQLAGSSTLAIDNEMVDIGTALPTAKLIVPGGETGSNWIRWDSLAYPITLGENDVWIVTVWCDLAYSTAYVQLRISRLTAPSGVDYRDVTWSPATLKRGWNVLVVKNTEVLVGPTDYGTVGTITASTVAITGSGNTAWDSTINSVRLRVYLGAGQTYRIGGVYTAPAGWCKAAVIWSADDIPKSFQTLAIPIIEEFGWKCTLNSVARYAANPANHSNYISLQDLRNLSAQGHEIWGHTLTHYDMTTGTLADKQRELRESAAFWNAAGVPTAAKNMAWPFLNYDATAISEAAAAGYRLARGGAGVFGQSWRPAIGAYSIPSVSMENTNSWYSDAHLNGAILRGQSVFSYMHMTVAGGSGIDTRPDLTQHYADHLRRWCQLVKSHEQAGRVVCCTASEYFRLCGVDASFDTFA